MDVPALEKLLSTGAAQPLPRKEWPEWARNKLGFTGMWVYPVLDPPADSTGTLSTGNLHSYIDVERTATSGSPLRYYRYYLAMTADGRVFQKSKSDRDVEYGHHRVERPPGLGPYRSTSTG